MMNVHCLPFVLMSLFERISKVVNQVAQRKLMTQSQWKSSPIFLSLPPRGRLTLLLEDGFTFQVDVSRFSTRVTVIPLIPAFGGGPLIRHINIS